MAKSSPKQPTAAEAIAPVVAPVESAPVAEDTAPAMDAAAAEQLAPEPKVEVGLESVAIIVAEVAPGVRRYITGLTDDGRVLAGDTREGAEIAPYKAKAIIKKVREAFPTAEIQLVLA